MFPAAVSISIRMLRAASSSADRLSAGLKRFFTMDIYVSKPYFPAPATLFDGMNHMSSLSRSPTPADLSITPRDMRFGRDDRQGRWWLNGDPIASAFHTALSGTFPRGEAMFIEAVEAHRDGVPARLARSEEHTS